MPQSSSIAIRQLISHIQQEAYAAIGMDTAAVKAFFESERARVARYLEDKPAYLRPKDDILAEDPSLDYIELDLVKRFDHPTPTTFEHPYLYSWLTDTWRYHCEKLYGRTQALESAVVLATAPTGRFNALALAGSSTHGILFENGLLHVLSGISNHLAYLLYVPTDDGRYQQKNSDELQAYATEHHHLLESIARIIQQYVIEGYSRQPGPIGDSYQEDFAIRHVLTSACWSFIFEHELFHLRHAAGSAPTIDQDFLEQRYQQVWQFFRDQLLPHLPVEMTADTFKKRYLNHQEELFADYFGLEAVVKIAREESTLSAALNGVLLFFLAAELTEFLLFELREPGAIQQIVEADGFNVSITAIVTEESHPYAFARRAGLVSGAKSNMPAIGEMLGRQATDVQWISEQVKAILQKGLEGQDPLPVPHPKWTRSKVTTHSYLR